MGQSHRAGRGGGVTQPHISHQSIPQRGPNPPPRNSSSGGAEAEVGLRAGGGTRRSGWGGLVPTGCWCHPLLVPARSCSSRRRFLEGHRAGGAPAGHTAPAPPVGTPPCPPPRAAPWGHPPRAVPSPPQTAAEGSAGFAGTNPVPATQPSLSPLPTFPPPGVPSPLAASVSPSPKTIS